MKQRVKTDKIGSACPAYMLKTDILPGVYIPTRNSMENKLLLQSRISLARVKTQIKNKIHVIIDRNKDYYIDLENLTDIFDKT